MLHLLNSLHYVQVYLFERKTLKYIDTHDIKISARRISFTKRFHMFLTVSETNPIKKIFCYKLIQVSSYLPRQNQLGLFSSKGAPTISQNTSNLHGHRCGHLALHFRPENMHIFQNVAQSNTWTCVHVCTNSRFQPSPECIAACQILSYFKKLQFYLILYNSITHLFSLSKCSRLLPRLKEMDERCLLAMGPNNITFIIQ